MANALYKANAMGEASRQYRLVKNSVTIKAGDWCKDQSSGMGPVTGVTDRIDGLVTAICNSTKTSLDAPSAGSVSGYTASTKTFISPADNQTVGLIMVEYIPVKEGDQFMATLSAAKGSTTGSNLEGYYLAISTSNASQIDETTASTSNTNTQFRIINPNLQGSTTEIVVQVTVRETE